MGAITRAGNALVPGCSNKVPVPNPIPGRLYDFRIFDLYDYAPLGAPHLWLLLS
jgi:hypothetical protein